MNLQKTAAIVGIAAGIVGIYYVIRSQRNSRTVGGVHIRKIKQMPRDATLGQVQSRRKYLGSRSNSSASGAGQAASLPAKIGRIGNRKLQRGNVIQFPNNGTNMPRARVNNRFRTGVGAAIS